MQFRAVSITYPPTVKLIFNLSADPELLRIVQAYDRAFYQFIIEQCRKVNDGYRNNPVSTELE